jgi:hypothetical protein
MNVWNTGALTNKVFAIVKEELSAKLVQLALFKTVKYANILQTFLSV